MTSSIRTHFEMELNKLAGDVLELGSRAKGAVGRGLEAFLDADVELAQEVVGADLEINQLRYTIEQQCYLIIAREQPVARDLRTIVSSLIVSNDLERVADHGKKIAKSTVRTIDSSRTMPLGDIRRMGLLALDMLDRSLGSLARRDVEEAKAVCLVDDQLDGLYKQVFNLSLSHMLEDPRTIGFGTYVLQVAHELERVGDRATNVAERVIYAATGELSDLNF